MDKNKIQEWCKSNVGKILISISEIIIAILLFIDPIGFTNGIVIACGAVMLLLGLINIVKYFVTKTEIATNERTLFSGMLFLVVGIFCCVESKWFIGVFSAVPVMYGIVLLLFALNGIQTAVNMIRLKNKKWLLELILAVVTLVFVVLIFVNPFGAGKGIWIFTGVILIAVAIYNLVLACLGLKAGKEAEASKAKEPKKKKTTK